MVIFLLGSAAAEEKHSMSFIRAPIPGEGTTFLPHEAPKGYFNSATLLLGFSVSLGITQAFGPQQITKHQLHGVDTRGKASFSSFFTAFSQNDNETHHFCDLKATGRKVGSDTLFQRSLPPPRVRNS